MNESQAAILKTITYLELFDAPLTAWEIYNYLDCPLDLVQTETELKNLVELGVIKSAQGFYTTDLALITKRQERFAESRIKLHKAQRVAEIFARLPWVRLVALANQIGANNWRKQGDLDFLIIAKPGKIWLTRLITAGLMALAGQRPTAQDNKDKICLSFFVSADKLSFDDYLLKPDDQYFRYWLVGLKPLYDAGNYYQQLLAANQKLMQSLPNWSMRLKGLTVGGQDKAWTWLKILDGLETKAKTWQMKHLPEELKKGQASGQVVMNDQVLKLHAKDRRRHFQDCWQTNWQNLKNSYELTRKIN